MLGFSLSVNYSRGNTVICGGTGAGCNGGMASGLIGRAVGNGLVGFGDTEGVCPAGLGLCLDLYLLSFGSTLGSVIWCYSLLININIHNWIL